jgi:hypothetical protein
LLVFDGETVGWFPQPDWTLLLMTWCPTFLHVIQQKYNVVLYE